MFIYFVMVANHIIYSATRREEHPPEILVQPGYTECGGGEMVEFVCQVQGYPEPRVQFFREGRMIACNENNDIGKNIWITLYTT